MTHGMSHMTTPSIIPWVVPHAVRVPHVVLLFVPWEIAWYGITRGTSHGMVHGTAYSWDVPLNALRPMGWPIGRPMGWYHMLTIGRSIGRPMGCSMAMECPMGTMSLGSIMVRLINRPMGYPMRWSSTYTPSHGTSHGYYVIPWRYHGSSHRSSCTTHLI